jgi:hypothetical protein
MAQSLGKTVFEFLKQLKIELPYDLAILPLGIFPKELKAGTQRFVHPGSQQHNCHKGETPSTQTSFHGRLDDGNVIEAGYWWLRL